MEQISIKGGQTYITEEAEYAYTVTSGHVLVYIVPYEEGKAGRKYLLYEAEEGDRIPALVFVNPQIAEWRFLLVALAISEKVSGSPKRSSGRTERTFFS